MNIKKLYELLEQSDEGKALAEEVKAEFGKLKDADAKARKTEADMQKLSAQLAALEKGKLGEDEEDDDEPAPGKKSGKASDAVADQLKLMQKQMKAMSDELKAAKTATEETKKQARTEKLRADFGGKLRENFGKFGETLADNLIMRGAVKVDDGTGSIVYETGDKAYDLDSAIELLKSEHKEYLVTKVAGSNLNPPRASAPVQAFLLFRRFPIHVQQLRHKHRVLTVLIVPGAHPVLSEAAFFVEAYGGGVRGPHFEARPYSALALRLRELARYE